MSATDAYEGHAIAQGRAARMAFEAQPKIQRAKLERKECEPVSLNKAKTRAKSERIDRIWDECLPIELVSESEIQQVDNPAEPISDPGVYGVQVAIYEIIDALCEGERDRGPAIATALKAVLRGEHQGESSAEIARAHGAPLSPLRRMLTGLRSRKFI